MSEIYVIRAILDAEEDVIRDVAITSNSSLFELHQLLVEAFELEKGEMSSFFNSNQEWDQGQEISMMDFDPETGMNPLDKMTVDEGFEGQGNRMLFVYDYLSLWTFYLEALEIKDQENGKTYPHVVAGVGTRPENAPHKEMKAENLEDDFQDFDEESDDLDEDDENDIWY